jgi:hypothetical protein
MRSVRGIGGEHMQAIRFLVPAVAAAFALSACGDNPGFSGDAGADAGPAAECAESGNWYDPGTGLCWQNPPAETAKSPGEAMSYCDGLSLGGLDDWRLPAIQELYSLERGCTDGVATGDPSAGGCGVSDPECLEAACAESSPACDCCEALGGSDGDPDGCYWDPGLSGPCDVYWSASPQTDNAFLTWTVPFQYGCVGAASASGFTRCVRGGA